MKITTRIVSGYGLFIAVLAGLVVYQIITINRMQSINRELSDINFQYSLACLQALRDRDLVEEYTWKSFAPVCAMVEASSLIVVQSGSPWKTLKDLVEDSKKSPGKITYSSSGTFGTNHLIPEALCKEAGIKWTYIPSQGSGPTITALLGGHVQVASTAIAPALPHLRAGTLRPLAVYRPTRMRALPDTPSLKELGYPIHSSSPYGILAPKDTPKEVVDTLAQAAKKALDNNRDFIAERLEKIGAEVGYEGPEEYTAHLGRQYELFSGILKIVKQ